MKNNHITLRLLCGAFVFFVWCAQLVRADDALFIGNSYTFGGPEMLVTNHGGIPRIIEAIAASKGKSLTTLMVTSPGKSLGYHLKHGDAMAAIGRKKWDWIILQDFSSEATHIGHLDAFFQDAIIFCQTIAKNSPATKVILYEPWARPAGSPFYTGASTAATFVDPAQMDEEIRTNYRRLMDKVKEAVPGQDVRVAPVGEAFSTCVKKYPEIALYNQDQHHANTSGYYLASLVIYTAMFGDNPIGATNHFFDTDIGAEKAAHLQEIAQQMR